MDGDWGFYKLKKEAEEGKKENIGGGRLLMSALTVASFHLNIDIALSNYGLMHCLGLYHGSEALYGSNIILDFFIIFFFTSLMAGIYLHWGRHGRRESI